MKVIIFSIIKIYLIIGICDVPEFIFRDSIGIFGNRNVVRLGVYRGVLMILVTINIHHTPK